MKTVTYQGPSDRRRTDDPRHPFLTRGVPVRVPNDLAEKLANAASVTVHDPEPAAGGADQEE